MTDIICILLRQFATRAVYVDVNKNTLLRYLGRSEGYFWQLELSHIII